jgi:hypothetical protein
MELGLRQFPGPGTHLDDGVQTCSLTEPLAQYLFLNWPADIPSQRFSALVRVICLPFPLLPRATDFDAGGAQTTTAARFAEYGAPRLLVREASNPFNSF